MACPVIILGVYDFYLLINEGSYISRTAYLWLVSSILIILAHKKRIQPRFLLKIVDSHTMIHNKKCYLLKPKVDTVSGCEKNDYLCPDHLYFLENIMNKHNL